MNNDALLSISAEARGTRSEAETNLLPTHTAPSKETAMLAKKMITIVDRIALGLMNTLVGVALPLVAVGLLTHAI